MGKNSKRQPFERNHNGGKNRWKKLAWVPRIAKNGVATCHDGTRYVVNETGWRRIA